MAAPAPITCNITEGARLAFHSLRVCMCMSTEGKNASSKMTLSANLLPSMCLMHYLEQGDCSIAQPGTAPAACLPPYMVLWDPAQCHSMLLVAATLQNLLSINSVAKGLIPDSDMQASPAVSQSRGLVDFWWQVSCPIC